MKRLAAITSAVVLVLALPGPGIGQDAATDDSIDDVTVLIANAGDQPVDLSRISASSDIRIVRLSSLRASASGGRNVYNMTLESFAAGLQALRVAVAANEMLTAKLTSEGFTAENVLAVSMTDDGSVTVYVDDQG